MPPQGSGAEQRLTGAFNAKTRLDRAARRRRGAADRRGRVGRAGPAGALQRLPDRGRRRRDDVRRRRAHDDARARAAPAPSSAASSRIVLGHGHTDHRGAAPGARRARLLPPGRGRRTPKAAAAFATGRRASPGLPFPHRQVHRLMHRYAWDGGPVQIAGTRRRGRRGRRLQGRRDPRPRAGADRAVARVRPPRAEQRLLLHARHLGTRLRAAPAAGRSTTTTPSRRARACASSPRWSPRPPGRATPSPSPATCARQLERRRAQAS